MVLATTDKKIRKIYIYIKKGEVKWDFQIRLTNFGMQ